MATFFFIAWKNIWRNKRRTLLTVAAVAFSLAVTLITISMTDGSHDTMIRNAMNLFSGYAQIHTKGFQDDPWVEKSFNFSPEIQKILEDTPHISGCAPRLQVGGLIASESNSIGGMVIGIDPDKEPGVTVINKKMFKGEFLSNKDRNRILIGEKLAQNLNVELGSKIVILTQGIDGSTGALPYKVKGIFRTGTDGMDRGMAFITLSDAQYLLRADDMVDSIALSTDTPRDVPAVVTALREKLSPLKHKFEVLGWKELMPELVQFVTLDSVCGYMFLAVLIIVVIFGVLSAVFTSVLERTREFGIMLALGTRPAQVVQMVMMEAFCLTFTGVVLGFILGMAFNLYGYYNPIPLPESTSSMTAQYGMDNALYFSFSPIRLGAAIVITVILSLLFSYYPAWKASRLKPDRAIRDIDH